MIVPMRKYAFLTHREDYQQFLEELRQLGVLHVQEREKSKENQMLIELHWRQRDLERVIRLLEKRGVEASPPDAELSIEDGMDACIQIAALENRLEDTAQHIKTLDRHLEELAPWGDFSLATLEGLKAAGWKVRLFVCPLRQYQAEWKEQHCLFEIGTAGPFIYFALVHSIEATVELEAEEAPWPAHDPAELRAERADAEARLAETERQMDHYAAHYLPLLRATLQRMLEKIGWEHVLSNTGREADEAVMVLEGFVPQPAEPALKAKLDSAKVVYVASKPSPEDRPPVLLKNSRFSRLFEPIGKLFALPAYQELDLTPFFAPFFMLFFGFCLGDAGYGLVILLFASLFKSRVAPNWKPILTLAQFLGFSTVLMGIFTGTVFGLNLLQEQFAWLGSLRDFMIDSNQAFALALILGLIQILFGLGLQAVNRAKQYGWAYAIPPIGWMGLLLSIIDLAQFELAGKASVYIAWTSVALIVIFSDPKAGPLGRLGKGLWDLYNITGFFGDLLSYIRLFALGISSAILGFVVNDSALQIKDGIPVLGPVVFVLFLIIGHGANLMIAALGAFVHPMRLTFVEFYKNAGFHGGGKAYAPFARQQDSKQP